MTTDDPGCRGGAARLIALLDQLDTDQPWRQQAACRTVDNRVFFPEQSTSFVNAKLICAHCPVQDECLDAGLGERFGVWGGLTETERRPLRRRRNAQRRWEQERTA